MQGEGRLTYSLVALRHSEFHYRVCPSEDEIENLL